MTVHVLDVVVITNDLPAHGLRAGDLGTVVEVFGPDAIGVEFVAASGQTKAVATLVQGDFRQATDNDLVAVRPASPRTNQDDLRGRLKN
jgi:hypothetical protein